MLATSCTAQCTDAHHVVKCQYDVMGFEQFRISGGGPSNRSSCFSAANLSPKVTGKWVSGKSGRLTATSSCRVMPPRHPAMSTYQVILPRNPATPSCPASHGQVITPRHHARYYATSSCHGNISNQESVNWLALKRGGSSFGLSGTAHSLPFTKVDKCNDAPAFDKGKKDHGGVLPTTSFSAS